MVINQKIKEKELTVIPEGRLDSAASGEFEAFLDTAFDDNIEKLILDFASVDFISSKGLRTVVSAYKKLNGRKMEIINANPSVKEVFRLSGLLSVLDVR